MTTKVQTTAEIVIGSLYNAGVRVVFGIPGAKIDAIFDTLQDHPEIRLIVCRHEQNAAFMAAAVGRITGIAGICIATSGPGASNLTTGLATATTEGDPVVAIIGSVPRLLNTKHTHQSMKALEILAPATKSAVNIDVEDQAAEIVVSAFRTASTSPQGATVFAIPQDVSAGKSSFTAFGPQAFLAPRLGPSPKEQLDDVARLIENAKLPVLFLGMRASSSKVVTAVRALISKHAIPVVETFQAAGAISQELRHLFYGRVGLFRNQIGDRLLAESDLVLALGYDPTEYDPPLWNQEGKLNIIHIDYQPCDYGKYYSPKTELLGSIVENINYLASEVKLTRNPNESAVARKLSQEFISWQQRHEVHSTSGLVHPLHFICTLQPLVSKDTTVTLDIGTSYIWMMRYFFAYEPRRLLCSNGQQTLGVALPWAIAASLVQEPPCSQKVISLSGDGGFMFSSMELSTAVQQKCNITHIIWNDESYNMVEFQEVLKYKRSSGVRLGGVDFVKFAESFGAKGFRINDSSEVENVLKEALSYTGVSIVDVKIDYSNVEELAKQLNSNELN